MQELKELREQIKAKMAACLTELRNMQYLEDMLEQAEVIPRNYILKYMQCFNLRCSKLDQLPMIHVSTFVHFGTEWLSHTL